jgi:hypothetical protein
MTNLANLTPVEVDTLYLLRLRIRSEAVSAVKCATSRVLREAGRNVPVRILNERGRYVVDYVHLHPSATQFLTYGKPNEFAEVEPYILTVERCIEDRLAPAAVQSLGASEAALGEAVEACRECEEEYRSRPWSRYWLVTSSDGHIHKSCHCSTCNKGKSPTGFALAAYLSGRDAAEAVADLGPALCSVCFPEAPVESKEQARISAALALCLAEKGCEAFQQALADAAAKAKAKAADRCPGSGQQGVDRDRHFHSCPVCGETNRLTSTGKVRPHRKPKFFVEDDHSYKCWTGTGWGPSTKKALYGTVAEAEAVIAQVSGNGAKPRLRRK